MKNTKYDKLINFKLPSDSLTNEIEKDNNSNDNNSSSSGESPRLEFELERII